MSQVVENLTVLAGAVESVRPHPAVPGYDEVTLRVDESRPVEGKADLIAPAPGDVLSIAVRHELVDDLAPKYRLTLRASRGGSGWIMAEPHPKPDDFLVSPA